jgi:hypothetical protein
MKTLIASAVISLFAAVSSVSFAQDITSGSFKSAETQDTRFTVYPLATGKVDVAVVKPEGEKVEIHLVDSNGFTLAYKVINKRSMQTRTRFDLNALPDGLYHVVITEGAEKQTKDVMIYTTVSDSFRKVNVG